MSSDLLSKSKSLLYSKFFSQKEEFEKCLSKFSLKTKTFIGSKRFGAISPGGVPLSFDEESKTVYVDDADNHSLIIGSTGSKKSRLVAMPMVKILESAKESMIICDPKAEIYNRTANDLKKDGYDVVTINLREPKKGESWNPLAIPYNFYKDGDFDRAYEFANDIATNLMTIDASIKDPFWDNSASSLFFGLTMLLIKLCKEKNLNSNYVNISNILALRSHMFQESIVKADSDLINFAKNDFFIYSLLVGTIETAPATRAGILSVFDQKMRTFSIQPSLLNMLSGDKNYIDKIQQKPTAIFLIIPDEKTSYHNLVSLFVKQSYEYMIFKAQSQEKKIFIRVNYILDEFSSLPNIHDFPAMITAARSRNIRFNLFIQSKHQLDLKYGEDAYTIRANCSNWIFLVSREISLLQEISDLCGVKRNEGSTIPILSITDLQHLDKDKGEILILSGRKKPFITRLSDIDVYDSNEYSILEFKQNYNKVENLDFENLFNDELNRLYDLAFKKKRG